MGIVERMVSELRHRSDRQGRLAGAIERRSISFGNSSIAQNCPMNMRGFLRVSAVREGGKRRVAISRTASIFSGGMRA